MCSACGYVVDAVGTADGGPGTPSEGDIAGCLNCGALHTLHGGGVWLATTAAEIASLDEDFRRELALNEAVRRQMIRTDLTKRHGGKA